MELAISKLTARRVIYYFEGYVKGERPKGLKFVFYKPQGCIYRIASSEARVGWHEIFHYESKIVGTDVL